MRATTLLSSRISARKTILLLYACLYMPYIYSSYLMLGVLLY
jgi:hypothetical protein